MMQVFDFKAMKAYPYEERDRNVFYKAREFIQNLIKKYNLIIKAKQEVEKMILEG